MLRTIKQPQIRAISLGIIAGLLLVFPIWQLHEMGGEAGYLYIRMWLATLAGLSRVVVPDQWAAMKMDSIFTTSSSIVIGFACLVLVCILLLNMVYPKIERRTALREIALVVFLPAVGLLPLAFTLIDHYFVQGAGRLFIMGAVLGAWIHLVFLSGTFYVFLTLLIGGRDLFEPRLLQGDALKLILVPALMMAGGGWIVVYVSQEGTHGSGILAGAALLLVALWAIRFTPPQASLHARD